MEFTAIIAAGSVPPATAICRFFYADGGINSTHFHVAGADFPTLNTTAVNNSKFHDEGFELMIGAIASASGTASPPNAPHVICRGFRAGSTFEAANIVKAFARRLIWPRSTRATWVRGGCIALQE